MSSTSLRLLTGASTNLTRISPAPALNLTGMVATNSAAYAIFVKFYWFTQSGTNLAPTVGTTLPAMTINIPTVATLPFIFPMGGVRNNGDLWVAVTKLVADTDTTVIAAGDGLITFFLG